MTTLLVAVAGCASAPAQPTGTEIIWDTPRPGPTTTGAGPSPPTKGPETTSPAEQPGECREYSQTVVIDGKEQQAYGRVCRQADGSWRVVQPADLPPLPGPPAQVATYPAYYPAYYPPYYYYPPPFFFGSAFFYSANRHHHHHRHGHRHR